MPKVELEPAERRTHAACPSETCLCPVCLIPRRLYEAWGVMDAARKLVKHNACITAAVMKMSKTPYPPTPAKCDCTYCVLKAALKRFDYADQAPAWKP